MCDIQELTELYTPVILGLEWAVKTNSLGPTLRFSTVLDLDIVLCCCLFGVIAGLNLPGITNVSQSLFSKNLIAFPPLLLRFESFQLLLLIISGTAIRVFPGPVLPVPPDITLGSVLVRVYAVEIFPPPAL